jgi:uncharacterized membrane protein YhhN
LKIAAYLYLLAAVVEVIADLMHYEVVHYIVKPLLMPLLIAFYLLSIRHKVAKLESLMIAAWAFSWIGDIVLMLAGSDKNYFLAGLIAFLITHVLFIFAFTLVNDRSAVPLLKRKIWLIIPLLIYIAALISVVFPAIGMDMKIPVAIYSCVIGLMVISALNRYKRVSDSSFALVFGGALLFMFSDSIIAINKFLFHGTLLMAGVWIMATYIAGQYLIAKGILKNNKD